LLPHPAMNTNRRTMPIVAPMAPRRLRGIPKHAAAPRIATKSATRSSGSRPIGRDLGAPSGATLPPKVEVSKLAGTVTENDVLVPPGNCASAVLTFSLTPDAGVHTTSEFGVKFDPFTVSVTLLPAVIEPGDAPDSIGTGPSTPKFSEFCAPVTLTGTSPELANADAGTATVSCVPLPDEASGVLPKFTVGFAGNP